MKAIEEYLTVENLAVLAECAHNYQELAEDIQRLVDQAPPKTIRLAPLVERLRIQQRAAEWLAAACEARTHGPSAEAQTLRKTALLVMDLNEPFGEMH